MNCFISFVMVATDAGLHHNFSSLHIPVMCQQILVAMLSFTVQLGGARVNVATWCIIKVNVACLVPGFYTGRCFSVWVITTSTPIILDPKESLLRFEHVSPLSVSVLG